MSRRALLGCLAAVAAVPGMAATPARAAMPNAAQQGRVDTIVRYLQDAQNPDGGWGGSVGATSSAMFTSWVALALAAGGVNPMDQRAGGTGLDAYSYLVGHAGELRLTTDFERTLLVVVAAGGDPHDLGGVDLVRRILDRQLPDGSFRHYPDDTAGGINDTAFAILPLSVIDEPEVRTAVGRAADWLQSPGVQDDDGGFSYFPGSLTSSDMTASVIEALRAAGRAGTAAEERGWPYVRRTQVEATGGFAQSHSEDEANTGSTAWTVQGMWAAGLEPAGFSDPSPLDYLASMQTPGGEIDYMVSNPKFNPLWMTAYCGPAFAGYPLPIPLVARATPPPTAAPVPTSPEQGVTSGGGGQGAPIFSRPEPQSQGRTAGGVRRTDPSSAEAEPRASTRRRSGTRTDARPTASSNGDGRTTGVTRDAPAGAPSPTPVPTPAVTATPASSAGLAGTAGAGGSGSGSSAGTGTISGRVIGLPRQGADGTSEADGAAPGLRAAAERDATALAAGLGALLLLAVGLGMNLERHRVARPA